VSFSYFLSRSGSCVCPELDTLLEDNSLLRKKRAWTGHASTLARCQVPSCKVDISELEGYHDGIGFVFDAQMRLLFLTVRPRYTVNSVENKSEVNYYES
jgi:hypothetical protein